MPKKSAVISGDVEEELLNADTLFELGFRHLMSPKEIKESKLDVYRKPSKKSRVELNLWDAAHFTSLDNKLPCYPRRTGFVTFDNMSSRKPLISHLDCNENRFNLKQDSTAISSSKHLSVVDFHKQQDRKSNWSQQMSDSLYDHSMMRLTQKTEKGIL